MPISKIKLSHVPNEGGVWLKCTVFNDTIPYNTTTFVQLGHVCYIRNDDLCDSEQTWWEFINISVQLQLFFCSSKYTIMIMFYWAIIIIEGLSGKSCRIRPQDLCQWRYIDLWRYTSPHDATNDLMIVLQVDQSINQSDNSIMILYYDRFNYSGLIWWPSSSKTDVKKCQDCCQV